MSASHPSPSQAQPSESSSLIGQLQAAMAQPEGHGADDNTAVPDDDDFDKVMQHITAPNTSVDPGFEFMGRELEIGDKADDAIDYEDFEDDDELPDEEPIAAKPQHAELPEADNLDALWGEGGDNAPGVEHLFEDAGGDDIDDLFGDVPSSPVNKETDVTMTQAPAEGDGEFGAHTGDKALPQDDDLFDQEEAPESPVSIDMDPDTLKDYRLQQALFALSAYGPDNPPAPPENREELLASLWPKFDKNAMPRFLELLPPKKARFTGKAPTKPPKRVNPTKVNLELAQDQEKLFCSSGNTQKRSLESEEQSIVAVPQTGTTGNDGEIVELDEDSDEELPGGVTMQDLQFICADWDVKSVVSEDEEPLPAPEEPHNDEDDWLYDTEAIRPTKKRKLGRDPSEFLSYSHIDFPLLDDPAETTAKLAKKIRIDMNDPHLLLDELDAEAPAQQRKGGKLRNLNETSGSLTKHLMQRYNISNDSAYDMLKENHQNKVRSTLGNIALEHSIPAVRLQWPYYKTKLARQEARSFHRPVLSFFPNLPVHFRKPAFIKRKHQRGKDVKSLYDSTKSLSLGDNSHVLLLEYSEEHPMMMSNFGMGSRLLNYYRKKNMEDTSRPKAEIGETAVLLPQDKSPFSLFGHVDPGETISAVTTSMFRSPVFRQEAKGTDFLVIRNSTGVEGSHYYLRKIENLYIAGQQFPSVDVPGPHSRKVTTAAKNRLKMLCYRLIKKSNTHRVSVSNVTEHFPGTTDMQNRQKMKEFLQFSKDYREWEMKPGEPIPAEDVLRGYVKPEDVCLLEAMQVGQQHLHDSGYDRDEDEIEDDEGREGESLEQQLAPWKTTRNFLLATQGKAMLQLHGEGDPTGRGEAFSFIKTSMKGGFRAVGESVEDKLDAQRLKELGGHSYNVARQQKSYEDAIRRIWEGQKKSLSTAIEQSDEDSDIDMDEADEPYNRRPDRPTSSFSRRDDETTSQFSRFSTSSQSGKILRITRQIRNARGQIEEVQEIVKDPRVIKQYQKHRHEAELLNLALIDAEPTGDKEADARLKKKIQDELNRLQRNKERRHAREKQKFLMVENTREGSPSTTAAGSPAPTPVAAPPPPPPPKPTGTQRKCAKFGQVGHIKTNKKLCPLLNGTMKPEDGSNISAFAMGTPGL